MPNKKQANKEIKKKVELQQEMLVHPENCYCYEILGIESIYDSNSPIGYTEPIDNYPYIGSKGYSQPIYICERCGKKVVNHIVIG